MRESVPTTVEERLHVETSLLGSLLLHPEAGAGISNILHPDDFCEESHRQIYEALTTLFETPELVTIDAVRTLLTEDELECAGGVLYLEFLQQQAERTAMPIEDQVQLLKLTRLSFLLDQAEKALHTQSSQGNGDLQWVVSDLERARQITAHLFSPKRSLPPLAGSFQAALDTYLGEIDERRRQRSAPIGIPTGFVDLDTVTGGLQCSDLVIVAGPPSIGKTSFALSVALHVLLKEHRSVGLFSMEAPTRRVIGRLLSMEANLDRHLLRSLAMDGDEWRRLGEASAILSTANLWIDDTANLSTSALRDKAHLLVEGSGVQLLIVDCVHLMLSNINDKRHENRVQEMGEISRSLKGLARELDIPVLALAQVSRAFEGRPSKKLQLSDLRDGSLENDADMILFLSQAEADTPEVPDTPRLATISIAKHRDGPRADLDICFVPTSARFRDLHTQPSASDLGQFSSASPSSANLQVKHIPRLKETMVRAMQVRQRSDEVEHPSLPVTVGEHGRALPIGAVLEEEESDDEPGENNTS